MLFSSLTDVLFFFLFLVPGITYSTIRRIYLGPRGVDFSPGSRILDATYVSILFIGIYGLIFAAVFGVNSTSAFADFEQWWQLVPSFCLIYLALVMFAALPGFVGYMTVKYELRESSAERRTLRQVLTNCWPFVRRPEIARVTSAPRAWDHAVLQESESCFVRIRQKNGEYVGGMYDGNSSASLFPHARDIYIAEKYFVDENGKFLYKPKNPTSLWVPITDDCIVEWVKATNGKYLS